MLNLFITLRIANSLFPIFFFSSCNVACVVACASIFFSPCSMSVLVIVFISALCSLRVCWKNMLFFLTYYLNIYLFTHLLTTIYRLLHTVSFDSCFHSYSISYFSHSINQLSTYFTISYTKAAPPMVHEASLIGRSSLIQYVSIDDWNSLSILNLKMKYLRDWSSAVFLHVYIY